MHIGEHSTVDRPVVRAFTIVCNPLRRACGGGDVSGLLIDDENDPFSQPCLSAPSDWRIADRCGLCPAVVVRPYKCLQL